MEFQIIVEQFVQCLKIWYVGEKRRERNLIILMNKIKKEMASFNKAMSLK